MTLMIARHLHTMDLTNVENNALRMLFQIFTKHHRTAITFSAFFMVFFFPHFICGFRGGWKRRTPPPPPLNLASIHFLRPYCEILAWIWKLFGSLRSLISVLFIKQTMERPNLTICSIKNCRALIYVNYLNTIQGILFQK